MFGYNNNFGYIKKQNPLKKAVAVYPMTGGRLVQKTVTNLVENGDFSQGTTGWVAESGATISATDNTLSSVGNGTATSCQVRSFRRFTKVLNNKVYITMLGRVTNPDCTLMRNTVECGGIKLVFSVNNPVVNQWYRMSGVVNIDSSITDNWFIYFLHSYADAATAEGKVMEVQEFMAIDLDELYEASKTPTASQCDIFFPDYFNGAKTFLLPENPASQEIEDASKPRVNLIPVDKQKFEGWTTYSGATVTLTQNQSVPEWSTTDATRIQSSGGSNVLKYLISCGIGAKNTPYVTSVKIKNIGATTAQILQNIGARTVDVQPGETKTVVINNSLGDGAKSLQLCFRTLNVDDSLDIIAYQPMVYVGTESFNNVPTGTAIKKSGILGSTVGVDTADPVYNGRGIKPDGTDDLVKMPVTFDPNNDFTVFIAADVGTEIPASVKYLWSLGNSTSDTEFIGLRKEGVSGKLFLRFIGEIGPGIDNQNIIPGIRLYMIKRSGNNVYLHDMFGNKPAPITVSGTATFDLQTLFALGRTTYVNYAPYETCFMAQFPYACSDEESLKIANHIRKILLQRGVDVA